MNERIFELIQAQNGFRGLLWTEEDKQEFAELIVRECADVLVAEMNRLDGLDRVVASQTMDTAQVLIKQHFGV